MAFISIFSRFWLHTNTSENECISRGMCSCDRAWAARFTVAVRVGDLVFRFLGFHGLRRDGGEENCCFLWGLSMSSGVLLKRTKGDVTRTRSVFCLFQIEKRRKNCQIINFSDLESSPSLRLCDTKKSTTSRWPLIIGHLKKANQWPLREDEVKQ